MRKKRNFAKNAIFYDFFHRGQEKAYVRYFLRGYRNFYVNAEKAKKRDFQQKNAIFGLEKKVRKSALNIIGGVWLKRKS